MEHFYFLYSLVKYRPLDIPDLYSKRNKQEISTLLIHDHIPPKLKNQIFHVWDEYINQKGIDDKLKDVFWNLAYKLICKEHGYGRIIYDQPGTKQTSKYQLELHYQVLQDVPLILDVIEAIFLNLQRVQNYFDRNFKTLGIPLEASIQELNRRFRENSFAFRYEQGKLIEIQSEILYQEAIKPAFELLNDKKFSGANKEFLAAHEHFRNDSYESCINECEKAYESVLKIICTEKGLRYAQGETAKPLTRKLIDAGLIPEYLLDYLLSVATIRNKVTAHGKGVLKIDVPEYLASFVLNQTASIVKYLIEAFKAPLPKS